MKKSKPSKHPNQLLDNTTQKKKVNANIYTTAASERLKETMNGQSFVQNKGSMINSQSMISLISNQTAVNQSATSTNQMQKSFQRRLSMSSLTSALNKTPARSQLETTQQKIIDAHIDKSTDLVKIKNGYFTNKKRQSVKQGNQAKLPASINSQQTSPTIKGIQRKGSFVGYSSNTSSQYQTSRVSPNMPKAKTTKQKGKVTKINSNNLTQHKENINNKSTHSLFLNLSSIDGKFIPKSSINSQRESSQMTDQCYESQSSSDYDKVLQSHDLNKQRAKIQKRSSFKESLRKSDDEVEIGFGGNDTMSLSRQKKRRLSQTAIEQEIVSIHLRQREREQTLIDKFNKLKEVAQNTMKAQHQQILSQTQPFNPQQYEQRMQRFESMIEILLDKNQSVQERNSPHNYLMKQKSSTQQIKEAFNLTQVNHNKSTFGGSMTLNNQLAGYDAGQFSMMESNNFEIGSGLIANLNNQGGQYLQAYQNDFMHFGGSVSSPSMQNINIGGTQNYLSLNNQEEPQQQFCSSSSTQDQRQPQHQQQVPQILDQTLPSNKLIGMNSGTSTQSKQFVLSTPMEDQNVLLTSEFNPSKNQISQFNLDPHNKRNSSNKDDNMKAFLDTLQSIEDYTQNQSGNDLLNLRQKLIFYRDQLKQSDKLCKTSPLYQMQQNQIISALETIIGKMDHQDGQQDTLKGNLRQQDRSLIEKQKYVILSRQDENINETSLDKSKIVLESLQTPTNSQLNQQLIFTNQNQDTPHQDYSKENDQTNMSYILSTHEVSKTYHLKTCNKSGYQAKHSRYLSSCDYPMVHQPLETNEELKNDNKSWLTEIKHLKTILGSIALNSSHHDKIVESRSTKSNDKNCLIF